MFARLNQFWFARIGVFVAVIWLWALSLTAVFGRLSWDSFKKAAIFGGLFYLLLCLAGYVVIGLWKLMKFVAYRGLLKPDSIRVAALKNGRLRRNRVPRYRE